MNTAIMSSLLAAMLVAASVRAMAYGVLARAERADMTQDLNRARQHIYNETHDAQVRR